MHDKPLSIIMVDDDPDDRRLFKYAFEESGIQINLLTIPEPDGLMDLLRDSSTDLPDIIFLDLNMPRKNGKECLKEIRQEEKLQNIRVLIFSTSANTIDIAETYELGANLYIQKPFDLVHLSETLTKVVSAYYKDRIPQPDMEEFVWAA